MIVNYSIYYSYEIRYFQLREQTWSAYFYFSNFGHNSLQAAGCRKLFTMCYLFRVMAPVGLDKIFHRLNETLRKCPLLLYGCTA